MAYQKNGRKRPMTEAEILSKVRSTVKEGVGFTDTKLSTERRRVTRYFNAELPAPQHSGDSKFVSQDVYDAVESMTSQLLDTFSAGDRIVQFVAQGEEDVEEARIATEYTSYMIFRRNDARANFMAAIKDGLMARNGIAKVYWDEDIEESEETFEGLSELELDELLADDMVDLTEEVEPDENGLYSGTIVRRRNNSRAAIESIPPEEFIVNPQVKSLESALRLGGLTHRMEKTKSELLEEGYPQAKVNAISVDDDLTLDEDLEVQTRFEQMGGLGRFSRESLEENDTVIVYETYLRICLDGTGRTKLYKIVHSGNVMLEMEQVDRHPFVTFAPIPIPHSFYGGNWAERVVPTQNAKTVLTRGILNHTVITNNPRYTVLKGGLVNPRELIDNRLGGIVNISRPEAVQPLQQASLNPFVFQTIAMLDEDKEDTTGISRLSQGLNKDAISNQNSTALVDQLISVSMQRQKTIARNFADQFLVPLYLAVYRLVIENDTPGRILEVAGNYIPVDPTAWAERRDVTVELRLGYGERDKMVEELLLLHKMLLEDPILSTGYGYEQRYKLIKRVLELKGYKNIQDFLPSPEQYQAPEPDPLAVAELKLKTQELALNERKMSLDEWMEKMSSEMDRTKLDMEQRFKTMEHLLSIKESERKDAETANRIDVAQAELELAQQIDASSPPENDKSSAIISPNS